MEILLKNTFVIYLQNFASVSHMHQLHRLESGVLHLLVKCNFEFSANVVNSVKIVDFTLPPYAFRHIIYRDIWFDNFSQIVR
jgi:hypothetical protein